MRSIRHWTPHYIKSRLAEMHFQRRFPELPWLTPEANAILSTYLKPSDVGLEFGSGRSTLWFASKTQQLTSVEDLPEWHERVKRMLHERGVSNVAYHHCPIDAAPEDGAGAAYVRVVDTIADATLDYVLVDGVYRDFCACEAQSKLKPGGVMIIDNVNWFLPSDSRSPNSRRAADGPQGAVWQRAYDTLKTWRSIWTSSGVTDTALYFKPVR